MKYFAKIVTVAISGYVRNHLNPANSDAEVNASPGAGGVPCGSSNQVLYF